MCAVLHGVGFMRVRAHQSILSLSMALSEVVDMRHTVDALWATPSPTDQLVTASDSCW